MLKQTKKSKGGEICCALCDKKFILQPGHLYKVTVEGKIYTLCSYTCYTKAKPKKKKRGDVLNENNM